MRYKIPVVLLGKEFWPKVSRLLSPRNKLSSRNTLKRQKQMTLIQLVVNGKWLSTVTDDLLSVTSPEGCGDAN